MSVSLCGGVSGLYNSQDVHVYWDNSNVFIEEKRIAAQRNGGKNAGFHLRLDFDNLMELAQAGRPQRRALTVSSGSELHSARDGNFVDPPTPNTWCQG